MAVSKGKKQRRVVFNPLRTCITETCLYLGQTYHSTRNGLYAHFCYEHHEKLIDEDDPEFESCTCGKQNPMT